MLKRPCVFLQLSVSNCQNYGRNDVGTNYFSRSNVNPVTSHVRKFLAYKEVRVIFVLGVQEVHWGHPDFGTDYLQQRRRWKNNIKVDIHKVGWVDWGHGLA
jgi:hypothetical protein